MANKYLKLNIPLFLLMKTGAIILLATFITYLGETMQIPIALNAGSKKTICCSKMMKQSCTKKPHTKRPSDNCNSDNNNGSVCANCPCNHITILDYYKYNLSCSLIFKKEYPQNSIGYISNYIAENWKPPNDITLLNLNNII